MVLETANQRQLIPGDRSLAITGSEPAAAHLAALPSSSESIEDLLEVIIAWTHAVAGTNEIVAASNRHFLDFGKVFHDDSFYDTRMSYFFNQLIFEHPLAPGKADRSPALTPYQLFFERAQASDPSPPEKTLELLASLSSYRHSLFQIRRLSSKAMSILDLLQPERLQITAKPGESFRALAKGTIFQGFIFKPLGEPCLGSGLILHPLQANSLIKKRLKQAAKNGAIDRNFVLSHLASLQLRHIRHRHVHPKLLYQSGWT